MNEAEWEEHFRSLPNAAADVRQPDALLEEILLRLTPPSSGTKNALDLACGAGANSLWLAEHGWNVTAVDRSPAAIELLRAKVIERGVQIPTVVANLEAHEFEIAPDRWDLILMCRYLQRDLFEPAAFGLAPGGVLIVIALLAEAGEQRFRVQPGELTACFGALPGFTIVHRREGATRDHRVSEIAIRRDGNPVK